GRKTETATGRLRTGCGSNGRSGSRDLRTRRSRSHPEGANADGTGRDVDGRGRIVMILLAGAAITAAPRVVAQTASKPEAPAAQAPARARTGTRAGANFDALAKRAREAREANRLVAAIGPYEQAPVLRPAWGGGARYLGSLHL